MTDSSALHASGFGPSNKQPASNNRRLVPAGDWRNLPGRETIQASQAPAPDAGRMVVVVKGGRLFPSDMIEISLPDGPQTEI
jgi:hypothetical protein